MMKKERPVTITGRFSDLLAGVFECERYIKITIKNGRYPL